MSFDNILADCLTLLDAGATEDECLARYPDHAEQLAPILEIAARLRSQPAPRLSSQTFASGRATLRAEAQRQQDLLAAHRRPTSASVAAQPHHRMSPHRPSTRSSWRPRTLPRQRVPRLFSAFHLMTGVLAAALVLLSGYTIARATSDSLPGDRIYAIKQLGENVEGVLMNAAGQSAAWHMQQTERRLHESLALDMRGQTPDPALTARINTSVQSAINASTDMSSAERSAFLALWLDNLRSLQIVFSTTPSVTSAPATEAPATGSPNGSSPALPSSTTLSQTIDTVEIAAENHAGAQSLPLIEKTDNTSSAESVIETVSGDMDSAGSVELPTPTAPSTGTASVTPMHTHTPTHTPTSTQTYTPTPHPTATSTPTPHPTATPTWTMTPPPTNTPTRSSSGGGDRPTKTPTHTPRPTDSPTPQPTDTPAPTESATATVTPGGAITGTPATTEPISTGTVEPSGTPEPSATTQQTPEPSDTPTTPVPTEEITTTPEPSDTPTTPVPTGEVTTTPEPSGTPTTPVPTGEVTTTPEPSGTSTTPVPTEEVTATPDPKETTEPTPTSEEPTATPPPDATATDIPTNTPGPTEQVATATAPAVMATSTPTPTPDDADIEPTETPIP